jgi:hypothetical protein
VEAIMQIGMAHLRTQGIDFAVFDADATDRTQQGRNRLLGELVARARANGLKVDKAALAFSEFGHVTFFGTPDLVRFLSNSGVPQWTHTLTV